MFHVEQEKEQQLLARPKDFLVSGKTFEVHLDLTTQIASTQPMPALEELPEYYSSKNYISHGNEKKTVTDKLYSLVQRMMFLRKAKWINCHTNSQQVAYLDFGCGTGAFVHYLNKKGWISYGVEPNEKARGFNSAHQNLYASEKELPKQQFDSIGLWHVLEHLPKPIKTIEQLEKRLKEEGVFFLALPNFNSFDAKHYKNAWAAYDVPRHLWHFSPQGIEGLMKELNYELIQKKGLVFDAIYISYLSEKQQQKSFPLLRGLFWGVVSNFCALWTGNYSSLVYVFQRKN